MNSKTLIAIHNESAEKNEAMKAKGFAGIGDQIIAATFGPNEEYPWPWRVARSKEGICDIYSGSNRIVGWLNRWQAAQIMREVNPDTTT